MSGSRPQKYAFIRHIILVLQYENLSYISIPIKKLKVTQRKPNPTVFSGNSLVYRIHFYYYSFLVL